MAGKNVLAAFKWRLASFSADLAEHLTFIAEILAVSMFILYDSHIFIEF
ncbi:hypothetical protein M3576_04570 [Weizmannia ginsengihumi]|nr:hypothetical protein [Heyndrickxia ginsengihumi]